MKDKESHSYEDFLQSISEFSEKQEGRDFLDSLSEYSSLSETPGKAVPVGERIKALREERGLSIEDLASRTGFDTAMLEQVENDMISPPLGIMVRLAKALDMKLGTLISSGDKQYSIIRKQDRKPISRYASKKGVKYGYAYESLAPEKKDRTMEPFLVTLEPADEEPKPSTHDGEEFIFVLDGEMEVRIGDETHVLHPGDCIYYDSTLPHLVKTKGDTITRILAVLTTGG